ncbi:response regulator [Solimicrobium silvestre]|uniref:Response regulator containing a CheY-like receiver domain and an HTH DNA-binding domain n=1 Tax=Solimicrobium silvestre TaxID=2099400 RepID=A0A2S9H0S5_9BURK|nr:response regulator transcription factor [Solimicrobium silvestre]PRC93466.1 Response regulator containing a CheY-like receiver domain and an HTH DNA-binding domain [Solimicrobium silvestre]
MSNKIKVLLVDDHAIVRNGVRLMLGEADDISVEGEAGDAQQALQLIRSQEFDVALVDIAMPDKNGLDLLKQLRAEQPKLAVLILSTYSEEIYAMRAFKLGAAGYLTKDSPTSALINAVRKAAAGGKHVSPAMMEKLVSAIGAGGGVGESHEALSNRELEVLKLIASGESLVKIADTLHLSPHTVTTYRARIMEKMNLSNNAELTRYAIENGLLA